VLTKTDLLRWLQIWCQVWSLSGSSVSLPISYTSQHHREASPDLIAASCSHPSKNQYSCILASQPLKASHIHISSVTWPPQCLKNTLGSKILGLKMLLQILLQAINSFVSSLVITISSTYITSRILFSCYIRQNKKWYFSAWQRPNSWITAAKCPNQALEDYFRP